MKTSMITAKDFCDIIGNKIANDVLKSMIRYSYPPHIAEQFCDAIDRKDCVDMFNRIMSKNWADYEYRLLLTIQKYGKGLVRGINGF